MAGQAPIARKDGTNYTARLRLRADKRLLVSGEDQLFTFADTLQVYVTGNPSGAGGYLESSPVPEGEEWGMTNVVAENETTDLTSIRMCRFCDGVQYCFACTTRAVPKTDRICWNGQEWATAEDTIRVTMVGCLAGDTCHVWITGYKMTKEA